ncbi:MAG: C39 family peptidase [Candidatus Eremiobacteraeota bacterium]|nr:C39 family peptidase [Candidatus Eremiobacteraeota bacterium]
MPITLVEGASETATLYCDPAREAVVSWNTTAPEGELRVRVLRAHRPDSEWLPHAHWSRTGRHSYSAKSSDIVVETDVLTSLTPFDGLEIAAEGVRFDLVALATPVQNRPSGQYDGRLRSVQVPARTQFVPEGPRTWCSPTALSMVNAYYGHDHDVATTARAVSDYAYNGTGNWSFNVAFSGALGLRGVVAYLRNLEHAAHFIDAGIPLVLSYSWRAGELTGAPLEQSDGHLVVLRGFTTTGDCLINDPAAEELTVVYPRRELEAVWLRNKGVAYVVARCDAPLRELLDR